MQTHLGNGSIQVLSILRTLTAPSEAESIKTNEQGISLVVQRLRLQASNAGGVGSIPGQGTKILHAVQCGQIKKNNNNKKTANGHIKGLVCSPENYRHHFQRICQGLT